MAKPVLANPEAEAAVLGALLVYPERFPEIVNQLREADFSEPRSRAVYAALRALDARSEPIELVSVGEELSRQGTFLIVGGRARLAELTMEVTTDAHLRHHAKIVGELAACRRVTDSAREVLRESQQINPAGFFDIPQFLKRSVDRFAEAAETRMATGPAFVAATVNELRARIEAGPVEGSEGLRIGLTDLDPIVCGVLAGDLLVVAARPGIGKTALVSNLAARVALDERAMPVLFISLEMPKLALLERFASALSGVDHYFIRTRQIPVSDRPRFDEALARLETAPLAIVDRSAQSMTEIRAIARRFQRERGLGLVVVDYLQLVQSPDAENRVQEVGAISRGLKTLASELAVPVVAAAQLNRAAEGTSDQRPRLTHLRESGSIEADASTVILLHQIADERRASDSRQVDAIVAKNRNGPVGTASLLFQPNFVRFVDRAESGRSGEWHG